MPYETWEVEGWSVVHVTVAAVWAGRAAMLEMAGAGRELGVTEFDAEDAADAPTEFEAFTVNVYVSGSEDGTNFDQDTAVMGASDAGYTIDSPTNLRLAAIINCSTTAKVYNKIFSVAQLFGGVMPRKWVVVVTNTTGATLSSSGNSMSYSGIIPTSS